MSIPQTITKGIIPKYSSRQNYNQAPKPLNQESSNESASSNILISKAYSSKNRMAGGLITGKQNISPKTPEDSRSDSSKQRSRQQKDFKIELDSIELQERLLQQEIQSIDFAGHKQRLFDSLQAITEENKEMEETFGKKPNFNNKPNQVSIKTRGNEEENKSNQNLLKMLQDYKVIPQRAIQIDLKSRENPENSKLVMKSSELVENNKPTQPQFKEIKVKQYFYDDPSQHEPVDETEEFYQPTDKREKSPLQKKYAGRGRTEPNEKRNSNKSKELGGNQRIFDKNERKIGANYGNKEVIKRTGQMIMRQSGASIGTSITNQLKKSESANKDELRDSKESLRTASKDYVRINPKIDIKKLLYS